MVRQDRDRHRLAELDRAHETVATTMLSPPA
jgi:hypothetical protein